MLLGHVQLIENMGLARVYSGRFLAVGHPEYGR